MVFSLSPSLKNSLIASARAFRERDEPAALRHLQDVARQNTSIENRIYGRLWEIMQCPNAIEFGRHAFWNQHSQTAPLSKKTQAIEDVLKSLIEQAGATPSPVSIPPGAKGVNIDAFIDCGFDPRFSFDGAYLNPEPKSRSLYKILSEWIAYAEFFLRAHLSWDPEERALRQMILTCAKTENTWANCMKHTFTEKYEEIYLIHAQEHEFLNQISELYKTVHPENRTPERLYPSELLIPLHYINQPQSSLWRKEYAKPGDWENGDLARAGSWGYWRLRNEMYRPYNESQRRTEMLDPFALRYVPHYIFINAIQNSADALKSALRDYRMALGSIVADPKCARSLQACKEKLFPKLQTFHGSWNRYTNSHELLKEVQAIFAKEDHYKPLHDYETGKMGMSKILSALYEKYSPAVYPNSHQQLFDRGYVSVKTAVQRDFPQSPNAQLLREYARICEL